MLTMLDGAEDTIASGYRGKRKIYPGGIALGSLSKHIPTHSLTRPLTEKGCLKFVVMVR